ncbi:hypothetical protein Hdeb2414_s0082g00780661 [Helianthus debilis subsp. tardiflorus]
MHVTASSSFDDVEMKSGEKRLKEKRKRRPNSGVRHKEMEATGLRGFLLLRVRERDYYFFNCLFLFYLYLYFCLFLRVYFLYLLVKTNTNTSIGTLFERY